MVWALHLEKKSNRQIGKELKVSRNRVNAIVRLGPPPEFVRVKEPSRAVEEPDWRKEARLLKEVEDRLPPEVKAREKEYQTAMEALTRLRRKRFPEIGEGYTTEPDF